MAQQTLISTAMLPVKQRLEFWHDSVCKHFASLELGVHNEDLSKGLRSTLVHSEFGKLDLIQLDACRQTVQRDHRKIIADAHRQHYTLFSLQLRGIGKVEQDGRQAIVRPGEAVLFDTSRPYSFQLDEDFEKIVIRIPSETLKTLFSRPDRLCAININSNAPGANLLFTYIGSLISEYKTLPQNCTSAFSNALIEMIGGMLQELPESKSANDSSIKKTHLYELKRTIATELANPKLGAELLSLQLGLSISSIYRIFSHEPIPLIQYIWNSRLERCFEDLINKCYLDLSITEIAFRWGFNSSAHFSRAFKERYGITPTAHRKNNFRSNRQV
jgi:AraC-like DNA-binding protein